jgi:hypothetical protein
VGRRNIFDAASAARGEFTPETGDELPPSTRTWEPTHTSLEETVGLRASRVIEPHTMR